MANIINIETSSPQCSVCLAKDGEIVLGFESAETMDHSVSLAPFVEKCLEWLKENNEKLDAVSVSNGPGSYTGLRIGLSLAKGICFALEVPLITLPTLEILSVRAMFSYHDLSGKEVIIPMIDARRMEVYTEAFDCGLKSLSPAQAMILTENSFEEFHDNDKILFIGDGSGKFKDLYKGRNAIWLGESLPHAKYMATLSEKYYRENRWADPAYSTPFYLKEYQAGKPKSKF